MDDTPLGDRISDACGVSEGGYHLPTCPQRDSLADRLERVGYEFIDGLTQPTEFLPPDERAVVNRAAEALREAEQIDGEGAGMGPARVSGSSAQDRPASEMRTDAVPSPPQRPDGVPEWAEYRSLWVWKDADGMAHRVDAEGRFYLLFPGPPDPVPSLIEQARERARRLRAELLDDDAVLLDALADELENRHGA